MTEREDDPVVERLRMMRIEAGHTRSELIMRTGELVVAVANGNVGRIADITRIVAGIAARLRDQTWEADTLQAELDGLIPPGTAGM